MAKTFVVVLLSVVFIGKLLIHERTMDPENGPLSSTDLGHVTTRKAPNTYSLGSTTLRRPPYRILVPARERT